MIVRSLVVFQSTLPDDQIEDEHGGIVQYGGKGVAEAVVEILRRMGCAVRDPEHAHEHGWTFPLYFEKRRFSCQVTDIGEFHLLIENDSWLERISGRHPQPYLDLLRGLARELEADPRFAELTWYTSREFSSRRVRGSSLPVESGRERR